MLPEKSELKYSSFLGLALPFTSCVTLGKSLVCLGFSFFNSVMKLLQGLVGMCLQKLRKKSEFEANPGYIVKPCLNKQKHGPGRWLG